MNREKESILFIYQINLNFCPKQLCIYVLCNMYHRGHFVKRVWTSRICEVLFEGLQHQSPGHHGKTAEDRTRWHGEICEGGGYPQGKWTATDYQKVLGLKTESCCLRLFLPQPSPAISVTGCREPTKHHHMWCDLGKSVWSRTCDIFSFLFDWSVHLERHIFLKTHLNWTSGSKVMSNLGRLSKQ